MVILEHNGGKVEVTPEAFPVVTQWLKDAENAVERAKQTINLDESKKAEIQDELKRKEEELATLKSQCDELRGQCDVLKKQMTDFNSDSFVASVKERRKLERIAEKVFNFDAKDEILDTLSNRDLKIKLIKEELGESMNLDEESDDYIRAAFDSVVLRKTSSKNIYDTNCKSLSQLTRNDDSKDDEGIAKLNEYYQSIQNAWRVK